MNPSKIGSKQFWKEHAMSTTCDPMLETYQDVEKMIYDLCHKFYARYGSVLGDFDDLVGEANVAFCEAYRGYTMERSRFTTWAYINVQGALMDKLRRAACKHKQHRHEDITEDMKAELPEPINLLDCLSPEANEVVRLALQMPADIEISAIRPGGKRRSPMRVLGAIQEYLQDAGWGAKEIVRVFDEIAEVL
jgi:RNA polymerase sigma factor (sigma-70 family)